MKKIISFTFGVVVSLLLCSVVYGEEPASFKLDYQYSGYGLVTQTLAHIAVKSYYQEHKIEPDFGLFIMPWITNATCATMIQAYNPKWDWSQWSNQVIIGGILSSITVKILF